MSEHLYLIHHGIKGQRWGVRNGPPYPLDEDEKSASEKKRGAAGVNEKEKTSFFKAHKKEIIIGASIAGATLLTLGGLYLYKQGVYDGGFATIHGDALANHMKMFEGSEPVTLPKGTVLQRVSREAIEDYTKRGQIYTSYRLRDNLRYMDRMPKVLGETSPYVHKLVATTEIKAPSRMEAAQLYLKLHPEATHAQFKNFMAYRIREDSDESREFVSAISQMGYNALIDENDAGAHWTKSPLILLDAAKTVDTKRVHRLSAFEKVVSVYAR